MTFSHLARQLIVVASPQLSALSVGGAVVFPSILLQQLSANGSSIHLEMDTASWIGSIHGLAGIPSILMPTIMQWKGRKLAFLIACIASIIGWILAVSATSPVAILISESFHGFGNNSLLAVSLLSMSEMIAPRFRSVAMLSFQLVQTFGMTVMCILGRYLPWKTVALIMGSPVFLASLLGIFWPESPSWLAYKGKFAKCERAFTCLRGTDEMAKREWNELIAAHKENRSTNIVHDTWPCDLRTLKRRDFYMPSLHMIVLFCLAYWSGGLVVFIYSADIIQRTTQNENVSFFGNILINGLHFLCVGISAILIRRFPDKNILLLSVVCTVVSLLCSSMINYMQEVDIISQDSLICIYFLVVYIIAMSLGVTPIVFTVAAELMPVKHRGVGGALYVICTCVFHASSLKSAPYLFLYIKLWGTLLLYAANATLCGLYLWKYIPETKGRTLVELEDFYNTGKFKTKRALQYLAEECIDS